MTNSEHTMDQVFSRYWKHIEHRRVTDAQKLWYWYYNDKDAIIQYVRSALAKTFKKKTLNKMNIRAYNIVERIIGKICLVYKKNPLRVLNGGIKQSSNAESVQSEPAFGGDDDKRYQELLLASTISSKAKEWHKLGRLFNTVLVQPVWIESGKAGFLDFVIHTPAWTVVESEENDWLRPRAFYFPVWKTIGDKFQQVLVYWSATEHYYIDHLGNKIAVPGNEHMLNPYGALPAAVLRFKEGIDFWGEGMWDLVDGNEEVCVQATNMFYIALFQAHGQPVGINLGLKGEPEIGPDKPILVDNAGGNDQQSSDFKFASANPIIREIRDLIDWAIKLMQSLKGLSPQQFALEAKLASGVSKMIDSADLTEIREDEVPILENFEHDLFAVTRAVYNYHNPSKKISEKSAFSIRFADQKPTKTIEEKVREREAGLAQGWLSLTDILLEDHPELTRQQAEEKVREIAGQAAKQ